jgi:coenzyme F420-reducing hydrogenase beta subunit
MYWHAQTANMNTWTCASSGGTIRTIVKELLIKRHITKAIMTRSMGCEATTLIVNTPSETLPATWYSYNRSLISTVLSEIADIDHMMIVALPCQARAIREVAPDALIISPVCFQTLDPAGIRKVLTRLDIDCEDVKSAYRVHDNLVIHLRLTTRSLPFKTFWKYFRFNQLPNCFCRSCKDHLGDAADITVFDNGSLRSNIIRVRTMRGISIIGQARDALKLKRSMFAHVIVIRKIVTHSITHLLATYHSRCDRLSQIFKS